MMDWGLDTSALVRVLTHQPPELADAVEQRLCDIIDAGGKIHVSTLVLSEAYYVLQKIYGLSKPQAIDAFNSLSLQPGFQFPPEAVAALSQPNPATMSPGLVDRMIAGEYLSRGLRVLACEKDFRKIAGTEVVA